MHPRTHCFLCSHTPAYMLHKLQQRGSIRTLVTSSCLRFPCGGAVFIVSLHPPPLLTDSLPPLLVMPAARFDSTALIVQFSALIFTVFLFFSLACFVSFILLLWTETGTVFQTKIKAKHQRTLLLIFSFNQRLYRNAPGPPELFFFVYKNTHTQKSIINKVIIICFLRRITNPNLEVHKHCKNTHNYERLITSLRCTEETSCGGFGYNPSFIKKSVQVVYIPNTCTKENVCSGSL